MFALSDIEQMTEANGEGWGYAHVRRVLKLIEIIREDVPHDAEVLTWATYLHDWGAFKCYAQPGVPHADRSCQIAAAEILPDTHFSDEQKVILLDAIEKHDYRDQRPVAFKESQLLREADWLDMLGAMGIVRQFAWGPNNLRTCYDRIVNFRDAVQHRLELPAAREIAARRIDQMNEVLRQISDEGFGFL